MTVAALVSVVPALVIARVGTWRGPDGIARPTLFDDAMISLSYARTLAGGHGLVWYPGAPRVEGITNLGWTLVMAGVHRLGLGADATVELVKALGLATVWATAAVAAALCADADPDEPASRFAGAAVVGLCLPLLFWSVAGMEVGLICLLTLASCWTAWRVADEPRRRWSVLLALLTVVGVVVRTDAVTVPAAILVWSLVAHRGATRRLVVPLVGGAVGALAATTAFRLAYYGALTPNTYDLKMTGVPLVERLGRGMVVSGLTALAVLLPAALVVAARWRSLGPPLRRNLALLLVVATTQVAYSVAVGGDAWESYLVANRYLTPAVVCLLLAATISLFARAGHESRLLPTSVAAVVAALTVGAPAAAATIHRLLGNRRIGDRLGLTTPDRSSILLGLAVGLGLVVLVLLVGRLVRARAGDERRVRLVGAWALTGCLLLGVASQAPAVTRHTDGAGDFAALGAELRAVTTDDAVIAVGAAGATQYFSRRRMIDLLGKNDRHIARLAATTPDFVPGHDKYDARWSLGRYEPDVVATGIVGGPDGPTDGRGFSDGELRELGYRPYRLRGGSFHSDAVVAEARVIYVRPDSTAVRFDRLVPVP